MIGLLPVLFHLFAARIVPHAPKSEFAFLILVAVVCAFVTRELGVYYLVGALVVGMAAQRFRVHLPAMASENMPHAVESFASLFVPFCFFHAGLLCGARTSAGSRCSRERCSWWSSSRSGSRSWRSTGASPWASRCARPCA